MNSKTLCFRMCARNPIHRTSLLHADEKCYHGDGSAYRGAHSNSVSSRQCLQWSVASASFEPSPSGFVLSQCTLLPLVSFLLVFILFLVLFFVFIFFYFFVFIFRFFCLFFVFLLIIFVFLCFLFSSFLCFYVWFNNFFNF